MQARCFYSSGVFSLHNITGIIAGIFTSVSMLPQLFKMVKEKSATGISAGMLVILMAGLAMWVVYGFMKKDWPVVATNLFSLALNISILILRWHYKHRPGKKKQGPEQG
jgi:MtN3 and saliva related transmembrane protein